MIYEILPNKELEQEFATKIQCAKFVKIDSSLLVAIMVTHRQTNNLLLSLSKEILLVSLAHPNIFCLDNIRILLLFLKETLPYEEVVIGDGGESRYSHRGWP